MKSRKTDYTRKRKETRTEPNPFAALTSRDRRRAIAAGVIAAAAKMGAGRHHKSTYSRTLAGRLKRANIEVIYHLRSQLAQLTKAK